MTPLRVAKQSWWVLGVGLAWISLLFVAHVLVRCCTSDVCCREWTNALREPKVGGTDNLGVALVGCRIMRALYKQPDPRLRYLIRSRLATKRGRWVSRSWGCAMGQAAYGRCHTVARRVACGVALHGDESQLVGGLFHGCRSTAAPFSWSKGIKHVTCVRCGIYRQGHHDKVSVEELSWMAQWNM